MENKKTLYYYQVVHGLYKKEKTYWQEMNIEYLIDLLTTALFKLSKDEFQETRTLEDGYCLV